MEVIMNILITGGAGFIGSEIVSQLNVDRKHNITVTVLDCLSEQIHGMNPENSYLYSSIKNNCEFIKADIQDLSKLKRAMKNCDCIIHLAAETGTGQSMYEINHYNQVNIMGTSNIFQAISDEKFPIQKIILASSRSVYGEGKYKCPNHGIIYPTGRNVEDMQHGDFSLYCPICHSKLDKQKTDESSMLYPLSLYAFTKYTQEKLVELMCKSMNINYTIFRFQNVYGVGQSLKNPYTGILSVFSSLMLENKDINIFEDGNESRDFINVKDIANGVIKSLTMEASNNQIINLGSGIGTSVLEIATILKECYNSSSKINITGDFRIGDIAHNIADIEKATTLLGWEPKISLNEGLEIFTNWVIGQERDSTFYEKSLQDLEKANMFMHKIH